MTTSTRAEIGCRCVAPDDGERIRIFDDAIAVKVTGADTGGVYSLATITVAPGGGPPLHAHPGNETFYVLSGEFAFTQRDASGVATFRGGPGTVVHAPGGAAHRFENVSAQPASMLFVASADTVDFLRELGAAFPPGAAPDMERMLAIHERYQVKTFHGAEGSRAEPAKDGATSTAARALAWRIQQVYDALLADIERLTPRQWRAPCPNTGWTVATEAHLVAMHLTATMEAILAATAGHPRPPVTRERLEALDARHAEEFANVPRARTFALLRHDGARAIQAYRQLTGAQLARTATLVAGDPPASIAELIERDVLGDILSHGERIRAAIAGQVG